MARPKLDFSLGYDVKDLFFDRAGVIRQLDKKKLDRLKKMGGKVRDATRRLIKVKAATKMQLEKLRTGSAQQRARVRASVDKKLRMKSEPGQPPYAHATGEKGLRTILFALEPRKEMVVVGPVKFNAKGKDVPHVLQEGGEVEAITRNPRWRKGSREPFFKRRKTKIAARPYMDVGLAKAIEKFPDLFSGMLQKRLF